MGAHQVGNEISPRVVTLCFCVFLASLIGIFFGNLVKIRLFAETYLYLSMSLSIYIIYCIYSLYLYLSLSGDSVTIVFLGAKSSHDNVTNFTKNTEKRKLFVNLFMSGFRDR